MFAVRLWITTSPYRWPIVSLPSTCMLLNSPRTALRTFTPRRDQLVICGQYIQNSAAVQFHCMRAVSPTVTNRQICYPTWRYLHCAGGGSSPCRLSVEEHDLTATSRNEINYGVVSRIHPEHVSVNSAINLQYSRSLSEELKLNICKVRFYLSFDTRFPSFRS
jgi:hypothetical protein